MASNELPADRSAPDAVRPDSGPARDGDRRGRTDRSALTRAGALLVGAVVAAAVVAARSAGLLDGAVGLAFVAVVLVALPTSRVVARRILLTGALAIGTAPLLWLVDLPVGDIGRVTPVLAVLTGGLAAWVLWGGRADAGSRARRLVPEVRAVDALPLVACAGGAAATAPWWRLTDASTGLATLLQGWDNSAHFSMVAMIRRHGLTIDRLADPGLEHWKFVDYPQGFHAVTATFMEVLGGPVPGTPADEVLLYVRGATGVLVLACVVATAAVAALPWARHHATLGVAAVAAIVATVTVVPGGESFVHGFPNFVFAAVLAACVPLLAVTMPRVAMPLHLAALASLLVAVAQGWILLLVVAGPAAAVILFRRGAWRGPLRSWWWVAAIAVAALGGLGWVLRTILALDASEVLVIEGGIVTHSPRLMALVVLLTPALLIVAGRWVRPLGWLAAGPVIGALAAGALGIYQRTAAGGLSYYFWKLLLGLLIIDLIVLAAAAVVALGRVRVPGGRRRTWHVAAVSVALVGAAAALTSTGFLPPGERSFAVTDAPPAALSDILAAAEATGPHDVADVAPEPRTLLLAPDAGIHPLNAQQWFLALTGRWTVEANSRGHDLLPPPADLAELTRRAQQALEVSVDTRVIAPPALADELRARLGELADRVVTWP